MATAATAMSAAQAQVGHADVTAAVLCRLDQLAVVGELGPGVEVVGEPEPVGLVELVEGGDDRAPRASGGALS